VDFPIFHHLPPEPQVSSFREYIPKAGNSDAKPGFTTAFASGWLLRFDASVRSEEKLKGEADGHGPVITHTYVPKLQDAVVVVRYWITPRILEIRIPNFSSRELVTSLRDSVTSTYGKHFHFTTAFEPWSMPPVCTSLLRRMLSEPTKEPTLRRISGSLLRERDRSTMKIEIENQDSADIRDTTARSNSISAYLSEKSMVESMIASFQPSKGDPEIRVVIGADDVNEISVRKTVSARELDHVIFRLNAHS
jgi:hypothetical protein